MSLAARLAPVLLFGAFAGARTDAQQPVVLRDAGRGPVARHLAGALAAPHRLISPPPPGTPDVPPEPTTALLPRDSVYSTTVIVLHRETIVAAHVHGDVIVVAGDVFMHPGAIVDGRVIAIGGGVYPSELAIARGGMESHRDFTYEITPTPTGYVLDWRPVREHPSPAFQLPGVYGLRIPGYDRVDGLSVPFGPTFSLDTGRIEIDAILTYRSDLGKFDPAANARLQFGRQTRAELFAGRTTLTNDAWIWSDLVNTAAVLALGLDTRNYYRADRVQGTLHRLFENATTGFEPYIGARAERDREVGPDVFATTGPWSAFGRASHERILRPNPPVTRGTLAGALLGARIEWESQSVRATIDVDNEAATFDVGSLRFVQSTIDAAIQFPTFGSQQFFLNAHGLHTFGDDAPPQRWSYLGGSGTISTLPLLSLGGDELVYVESNYLIPLQKFDLPLLGAPSVTLRHMIGSAGVGRLPSLQQNLALRLALSFARFDAVVDPARKEWDFGFGLSMAR